MNRWCNQFTLFFILLSLTVGCTRQPVKTLASAPDNLLVKPPEMSVASSETSSSNDTPPKKSNLQALPSQLPLPVYETLTYQVHWLTFNVGTITASIKGIKEYKGRWVYLLETKAKSNSFLSAICPITSTFISYMDIERLCSLREEVYRREGGYKKDAIVEYDQENHVAHFKHLLTGEEKTFPIEPNQQDALTAIYYFRTLPLEVGKSFDYNITVSEKNYKLFSKVIEKKMFKLVGFGQQEGVTIQPYAYLDNEEVKKGRAKTSFSTGSTHIPLYATIETPIFTRATVTLIDVSYPNIEK